MAGNSAIERYEAFENLKSQFDKKVEESPRNVIVRRKSNSNFKLKTNGEGGYCSSADSESWNGGFNKSRERADGEGPNLVSLTEAGDLLQLNLSNNTEYASKTFVKGCWKNSDLIKSNHLNSPDHEAVETASVTSCSSAYSSKSDSSFLSPQIGSFTELSDAGSCDTHQEYDIHPVKTKGVSKPWSTSAIESQEQVLSQQVITNMTMWSKMIGDWKSESIENEASTPTSEQRHQESDKLPTPMRSMENLLDCGCMLSLCSDSSCLSSESSVATGKFVWKKRMSTSNLIDMFEPSSGDKNGTATLKSTQTKDALKQQDSTNIDDQKQDDSQQKENDLKSKQNADPETNIVENGKKETVVTKNEEVATRESSLSSQYLSDEKEREVEPVQTTRPKPNIRSVSDRIKQLRRSQTEPELQTPLSATTHIRPSKFGDAYKVYRELQTLSESTSPSQNKRKLVSVKERAQVFTQK